MSPIVTAQRALRQVLDMEDVPVKALTLAHEALQELERVAVEPPLETPGLEEQAAALARACSKSRRGIALAVLKRAAGILEQGSFKGGYRGPSRFAPPAGH